jgi:U6 snRNA-associated Sm-like protein LSm4
MLRHSSTLLLRNQDGDRFFSMEETYIRGNTIKYIRVPEEVPAVQLTHMMQS